MRKIAIIMMRIANALNTSPRLGFFLLVQVQMSNVLAMVGTEQNIEMAGMQIDCSLVEYCNLYIFEVRILVV